MNSSDKKSFNSIDLFKFLLSIVVVAGHTHPFENNHQNPWYPVYLMVCDFVIPFFFLSTGFLLGKKVNNQYHNKKSLKIIAQYLKKTLILYCIWSVIYLPLAIISYRSKGWNLEKSICSYLQAFFFIGEHFNSWMLWYLLSTAYAVAFYLVLLKYTRCETKHMVYIGTLFLLLGIGINYLNEFNSPLPLLLLFIRNKVSQTIVTGRIFQGFFYIPLGMLLAQNQIDIYAAFLLLIVGILQHFSAGDSLSNEISVFFRSVALFTGILHLHLPDSKVYFILRKMSSAIYFIHLMIWTVFYTLKYGKITYGAESFFVTAGLSLIISFVYVLVRYKSFFFKKRTAV